MKNILLYQDLYLNIRIVENKNKVIKIVGEDFFILRYSFVIMMKKSA